MKSSYSAANSGNCVEIAPAFPGAIPVRDSKDPLGPILAFDRSAWAAFVGAVRDGDLAE
ncbi:DUF397 domain-containing protein [Streptomyces sp. DH12]|uniref:DUF397 domain-containing protein n=1 Tax=Streptomyces sp. DH12 TaxID=2857010 RepID=UPI001E465C5B|nr:DUF397 domain-containing protein [Streptomyces sp. DH12]